ncbi:MAG: SIS domain-containing protein [Bacteroidales bacterium]|nr:SIS domain-containing protein [Bacteroidales bacterium]
MLEEIKELLRRESEAILKIPASEAFEEAIALIGKKVHEDHGKLVCSGMGKAGQIAINIATTFSSTGTPAIFLHPSDAQHGDLGVIQENDILLLISNSGKTREIIELVGLAKGLYHGLPLIVITGDPEGDLARQADVTLHTGHPEEVCPMGLTPTTSTTTMTVIGDILVVLMIQKIGFKPVDYAKRHHGGYLGIKSRNSD